MFFANLLPLDIPIMESFIKTKVQEIAGIVYKENTAGMIPKTEVPYLVRYFLQFPSQTQVVDEIIPEVEKLEGDVEKSKDEIVLEALEKYLIQILKLNQYPNYEKEILLEAFRVLDAERNGYIDLHTFYTFVKSYGVSFTKDQIAEMEKFLCENETDFLEPLKVKEYQRQKQNQYTTRKFYYESYVRKVVMDNKKHFDSLIGDFRIYMEVYKKQKEMDRLTNI